MPADGSLRPLRDARDRDERTRRGELAGEIDRAQNASDAVARAQARVAAIEAAIAAARSRTFEASWDRALNDRYLARKRAELDAARIDLARVVAAQAAQDTVVDAARVRLAHARAAKEVVERHFSRWREAQRKIAERKEE